MSASATPPMLSVLVLAGLVSLSASEPHTDASPADGEVAAVLGAWEIRSEQFLGCVSEWVITEQFRAGLREEFDDPDARADRSRVEIQFDGGTLRLTGSCLPSIQLDGVTAMDSVEQLKQSYLEKDPQRSSWRRSWQSRQYFHALYSKFEEGHHVETFQPYTMLSSKEQEVHVWEAEGAGYPRAIIGPGDMVSRELLFDAETQLPPRIPVMASLLDAFQLSVRPTLRLEDGEECRLLPHRPTADGRVCLAIEEPWFQGGTRCLWVDPGRGNVVVRCLLRDRSDLTRAQYDISYDSPSLGLWLPSRITALHLIGLAAAGQKRPFDDLYDAVTIERSSSFESSVGSLSIPVVEFPPGTWVNDRTNRKCYYLRADGTERLIPDRELISGLTYRQLQFGETLWGGWLEEMAARTWRGRAFGLVTWPGIVPTVCVVGILGAAVCAVRRILNGRAVHKASKIAADHQQVAERTCVADDPAESAFRSRGGD